MGLFCFVSSSYLVGVLGGLGEQLLAQLQPLFEARARLARTLQRGVQPPVLRDDG
jgi:hypothetical protein